MTAGNPSYDKLREVVAKGLTEVLHLRVHPKSSVVQTMMDAIWPEIDEMLCEQFEDGLYEGRLEAEL